MRRCYNGFGRTIQGASYLPFNKIQKTLTDSSTARVPLSVDHHQLLFEDFVELKPDTKVTFLISHMNHFLTDKRSLKMFEVKLKANPLVSRVISGKSYFAFDAVFVPIPNLQISSQQLYETRDCAPVWFP